MNKKILTILILSAMFFGTSISLATENVFKQIGTDVVNTNKKILKDAADLQTKAALDKKDAEIAKYNKKIEKKQAEIKKIQQNSELTKNEKAQKIKALNQQIKELKITVKDLQK